jgi:hypothetical protein
MKAKVLVVVLVVVGMVTGFIGGKHYTTNNTEATIGEHGEINIFVKDTNVSQRELTSEEVEFIEANQNLVPIETVEQNLVPIEEKEVREQSLTPIKEVEIKN